MLRVEGVSVRFGGVLAVQDLTRAQILGAREGETEILPEVTQQLLPVDFMVGHPVELFLQIGPRPAGLHPE